MDLGAVNLGNSLLQPFDRESHFLWEDFEKPWYYHDYKVSGFV